MSGMTRFVIRAVCALGGFIVGTFVVGVVVGLLGLYGTLAAALTVVAGLAAAYGGYRVGLVVVDRREGGAYADPGYPPRPSEQPYERPYQSYDQQGYDRQRGYAGEWSEPGAHSPRHRR